MTTRFTSALLGIFLFAQALPQSAFGEAPPSTASSATPAEATANTQEFPKQILRTGINLNATGVSPNSLQLANNIQLTPLVERMQMLRSRVDSLSPSIERAEARIDFLETKQKAIALVCKTGLEVDYAMAEMTAEQNVYNEILSTFTGDRDKLLARVNAASFISNGILWAICEGMSIPSINTNYAKDSSKVVQWPIPSGIVGVAAGIVPSLASMYTLRAVNGKKKKSEVEPNMLAKLFNYPVHADIEYPSSVWSFLNEVPADQPKGKTRKDQLIDRWISDSNIPGFTNRDSKQQLNVVTACVSEKKGLSIATLSTRLVMLQQLSAEVNKMKRMLLELAMVVEGEKQLVAMQPPSGPTSLRVTPPTTPTAKLPVDEESGARQLTAQTMDSIFGVP